MSFSFILALLALVLSVIGAVMQHTSVPGVLIAVAVRAAVVGLAARPEARVSDRIFFSWDAKKPDFFRLEQDYTRETSAGPITVPAGFETDWASIPRQLRRQLPQWERYNDAALFHDWLYATQPDGITRKKADDIFLELMKADGVTVGRARSHASQPVRAYGDTAWRNHQKTPRGPEMRSRMKASELIRRLEEQIHAHGDSTVGIIMDQRQDLTSDEVTAVWTLTVSDRSRHIVNRLQIHTFQSLGFKGRMNSIDLDELEQLLAAYRKALPPNGSGRVVLGRARRNLETALVAHVDELIEGAKIAHALDVLEVTEVKSAKLAEYPHPHRKSAA